MSEEVPRKFSDVIGALVASVAHARSVADVAALRIARQYRENDLLKGMPVPRLRFRKVSISLPVILTDLISGAPAEMSPIHIIETTTVQAFIDGVVELAASLDRAESLDSPSDEEKQRLARYRRLLNFVQEGDFSKRFKNDFSEELHKALRCLDAHEGVVASSSDVAVQSAVGDACELAFKKLFDETTYRYIQRRIDEEGGDFDAERARQDAKVLNEDAFILDMKKQIRHAAEDAAIAKATVPPDFAVSVNTDQIKNAGGGPDVVTRISMVLAEEGLEWVTEVTHDGKESSKLIPE